MTTTHYETEFEFENEFEFEHEHEHEFESEHEHEHESEHEAEQFFGSLLNLAKRGLQSPQLRKIAANAAKAALQTGSNALFGDDESEFESEFEYEHEFESEYEAEQFLGKLLGGLFGGGDSEFEGEFEFEHEFESEFEFEGEFETGQSRKEMVNHAMMEHIAKLAANAQTQQEAEQFLPFLIPLAAKALPFLAKGGAMLAKKALPMLAKKVVPQLMRGMKGIAKSLGRSPRRRHLMRAMPRVANMTMRQLAQNPRAATPQRVRRVLAQNTARVLSNPRQVVTAYRRGRRLNSRLQRSLISINVGPVYGGKCAHCGRRRR